MKIIEKSNLLTRLQNKINISSKWKIQETSILVNLTSHIAFFYQELDPYLLPDKCWSQISQCLPGRTGNDCRFKLFSLIKHNLIYHRWTQQQNDILAQLIDQSRMIDWHAISQELFLRNKQDKKVYRSARQCKQNYEQNLDPEMLKGNWTFQDDRKILNFFRQNGKITKELTKLLPNRNRVNLKNRLTHLIRKFKLEQEEIILGPPVSNVRVSLISNYL